MVAAVCNVAAELVGDILFNALLSCQLRVGGSSKNRGPSSMWLVGGSIAGIRLASIGLRFGLTIYVTSTLGLVAMGQFGLILGLAALSPALFGFGLNFHMARALVGKEPDLQLAIIRSRIGFTLAVLLLASAVCIPLALSQSAFPILLVALICAILWGEALGMDIYIALTALRFNVLANLSLALRTAFWIPLVIMLAALDGAYRNLETLLACWLLGQIANCLVVYLILRRSLGDGGHGDASSGWARSNVKAGLRIWPSDLALVAIAFGDRFILSGTVSEQDLGIFVFFWSFANVAQTLIQASIITPSLPRLILLHRENGREWRRQVKRLALIVGGMGSLLGVGIYAFIWLVHETIPEANFPWVPLFGALVIAATIMRFLGDFFSTVLNSAGAANAYSALNIGFAVTLLLVLIPASVRGGIVAAAITLLAVSAVFNLLKFRAIRRIVDEMHAQK